MSLARVSSRASIGVQAPIVDIEVHLANGLPSFTIVGLPEASVREARERVRDDVEEVGLTQVPIAPLVGRVDALGLDHDVLHLQSNWRSPRRVAWTGDWPAHDRR